MTPVLSTRLFGRLPGPHELALARQQGFLDLEVWLDQLPGLDDGRALQFSRDACDKGIRFPCVHLPTASQAADSEQLGLWQRALRLANRWGSRYAVVHLSARQADLAERLCETAHEQGIALAFEADTVSGSGVGDLLRLLRDLGPAARGDGLCLDLARTPSIDRDTLARIGNRLLWLEVSGHRGDTLHLVPRPEDTELRERMESCSRLPYVAYEVVPAGPPGMAAGAAQLTVLLRQLHLFHLGGGRTTYEGVPPFLPMG